MRHWPARSAFLPVAVLAAALLSEGCAAKWAYRQGKHEAEKGNWDLAVARLTKALRKDPAERFQKVEDLRAALAAVRTPGRHVTADSGSAPSWPPPATRGVNGAPSRT